MDRKTFIKAGCMACASMGFLATMLQSCAPVRYVTAGLNNDGMLIDPKEFETKHKGEVSYRSYIIARHDDLKYPVCIYRVEEGKYSALLMSCTHQGAELQVSGDQLTCPAHGSEFDKYGKVTQSPAAADLRSFPVSLIDGKLFIDLRKQA